MASKGETIEIPIQHLLKGYQIPESIQKHFDMDWSRARELFEQGDYPLAVICATTLIDELGKVVQIGVEGEATKNHGRRYLYSLTFGTAFKSRIHDLYAGDDKRVREIVRPSRLFEMRNKAMYFELENGIWVTPEEAIDRDDALLLVGFAGELYAEAYRRVGGPALAKWETITSEADAFRAFNRPSTPPAAR